MSAILIALSIIAAVIYVVAMQQDLSYRQIPNSVSIALVGIAVVKWSVLGEFSPAMWALLVALVIFAITFMLFTIGWMGGGDVKLLTASSFMLGAWATYPFLVYTALAGGVVTLCVLVTSLAARCFRRRKESDIDGTTLAVVRRATVPYGVAISIGALWIMFQQSALNQQTLLR